MTAKTSRSAQRPQEAFACPVARGACDLPPQEARRASRFTRPLHGPWLMDAGCALCRAPPRDKQMANKMLIDATHPEETRVVVLRGNRVEEFDFESASRRQLRGNIYLAKVTRVEPSLQAAFIDYGGNRHGFLAFSEIHPDYYQIPVADRQALIDEEERAHRDAEAEADRRADMRQRPPRRRGAERPSETVASEPISDDVIEHDAVQHDADAVPHEHADASPDARTGADGDEAEAGGPPSGRRVNGKAPMRAALDPHLTAPQPDDESSPAGMMNGATPGHEEGSHHPGGAGVHGGGEAAGEEGHDDEDGHGDDGEEEEIVESVGGDDALEEV